MRIFHVTKQGKFPGYKALWRTNIAHSVQEVEASQDDEGKGGEAE